MDKEIQDSLRGSIPKWMEEKKVNWAILQTISLKKTFGCPVEWQTLHNIMKKDSYKLHPNNQSKLLNSFGTKHERLFNDIKLT